MHKILTEGQIHYVQGCIHHVFDKVGNDFEGFFGKKLTMYHCAVMGCAVRKLREKNIVTTPGRFAALIDDGLLRVQLPKDSFEIRKAQVLDEIEAVYAKAAMRISWDKTYVSTRFATFLHETRLSGRSITPGFRAILKMTSKADEPVDCLASDLAVCSSTAFGAVAAGAPLVATYAIYLMNIMDALRRWRKRSKGFKEDAAIKCFFPLQYGGLALESMITLAGSLKGPTIPECLGHLELIGYRFPNVRKYVNAHLSQALVHASERAKLVSPGTMMILKTRLRGDRYTKLIERSLISKLNSPVIKSLLGVAKNSSITFVELALEVGSFIPHQFS